MNATFIFLVLCGSCRRQPDAPVSPAFYHWKTTLNIVPDERSFLDSLACKTLYIKFLDIAKDPESHEIRPYSIVDIADTNALRGRHIIPVIFIANQVFEGIAPEKTDWLCQKIAESLAANGHRLPKVCLPFEEIQFDCDWTNGTRAAFFSFLKKFRKKIPKPTQLSATIRLHQYKFPSATGIPPADRGILMLYNTGVVDDPEETNSIFETAAAQKYLIGAPARYPLPLDLALPLFSWGVVFRDDAFWKIIPDITVEALSDTALFKREPYPDRQRYSVRKGTFLGGHYLRPGYEIRIESMDPERLAAAAAAARVVVLAPDARLAFYHLDSAIIRRFSTKNLQRIIKR